MKKNKRTLKNVIMIVLAVLVIGALIFTSGLIRFGGGDMPDNAQGMPPQTQMEDGAGSSEEPPEKPEGEDKTATENGEKPDVENGEKPDSEDMPEMKEGEEPPEMPEGMDESDMQNSKPGEKPDGMPGGMGVTRIVLTGAEALILSIIIMYLIMSGFNRKTFKETLPDTKKKIIYIIVTLLLGAAVTGGMTFIPMKLMGMQGGPGQAPQGQTQEITELPDKDGTQNEDSEETQEDDSEGSTQQL